MDVIEYLESFYFVKLTILRSFAKIRFDEYRTKGKQ